LQRPTYKPNSLDVSKWYDMKLSSPTMFYIRAFPRICLECPCIYGTIIPEAILRYFTNQFLIINNEW